MLGTCVNAAAILTGSFIGSFVSRGIGEKYKNGLFDALGLATVALGVNAVVSNMPKSEYPVLFIFSLALGTVIGTALDINGRFHGLLQSAKGGSRLAEGLSTAILLFCIGTLSILGPIESRLNGNNTYLLTNATLDFVSSIILSSAYGFGIALAAVVLFLWQGSIFLFRAVYDAVSNGGNLAGRRRFSHELRYRYFEPARLQDAEHAAGTFGAAAVFLSSAAAAIKNTLKIVSCLTVLSVFIFSAADKSCFR